MEYDFVLLEYIISYLALFTVHKVNHLIMLFIGLHS